MFFSPGRINTKGPSTLRHFDYASVRREAERATPRFVLRVNSAEVFTPS